MVGYCRTTDCLHRYMTRYFGQELSPNAGSTAGEDIAADSSQSGKCGACSNCESTFETIDVTRVAQAISRCVHDVGQRVGSGKIVKILRGSRAQDLAWLNPERMPTFGMLKDVNEARVRDVLSQMATDGYLSIAEGRMPIVMFGARAAETAAPDFHYEIKRVERKSEAAGSGRSGGVADTADSANVPGDALARISRTMTRNRCSRSYANCDAPSPRKSASRRTSCSPTRPCATWPASSRLPTRNFWRSTASVNTSSTSTASASCKPSPRSMPGVRHNNLL